MIALLEGRHSGADVDDDARAFVTEDDGEKTLGVAAGPRELVGVADPRRLDLDEHLSGLRSLEVDVFDDLRPGLVSDRRTRFRAPASIAEPLRKGRSTTTVSGSLHVSSLVISLSATPGRPIIRKYDGPVPLDTMDIAALASIEVTSEEELYPVDHIFDGRNGPGGSCWMASTDGPQVIVLRFHRPIAVLTRVAVESEERGGKGTQRIELSGWSEDTQRPFETPPRELEYTPYGPSFHRATWDIMERNVSHIRLRITPGPQRRRASLTAIILR